MNHIYTRVYQTCDLNTECVPPTTMKQAIDDRFSGAYAEQTATESENANQNGDEPTAVDAE